MNERASAVGAVGEKSRGVHSTPCTLIGTYACAICALQFELRCDFVWRETKFWHDLIQVARRQCGIHHRPTCAPFTVRILAAWEQPLPVEYSTRVGGAVGKHGGQTAVGCQVRTAAHGIRKGAQCTGQCGVVSRR